MRLRRIRRVADRGHGRTAVMASSSVILTRWRLLSPYLNRRQRILWAAAEAEAIGRGGIVLVSRITGISKPPISRGMRKVRVTNGSAAGSLIPSKGSHHTGRKPVELTDA